MIRKKRTMDTRITPFGDHPDGGKITELKEGEPIPDYMMPVSEETRKILENVPQDQRMSFILNSDNPKLQPEKEWIENKLRNGGLKLTELKNGEEQMSQPDLRTKEGAMNFLDYHAPTTENLWKHNEVNNTFQTTLNYLWDIIPDGPGKTRFVHALNLARMEANSCIANEGA